MRTLFMLALATLLIASGCAVAVHPGRPGYHGSPRHYSSGHGHYRSHRHWNAAGPAYAEASVLTELVILPATLPKEIDGVYSSADETFWRRDWPAVASKLIADGLTTRTDGVVTGTVGKSRPSSGHYMRLDITYLDVGDVRTNEDGTPRARGSSLAAHGVIINAATGQIVADVKFAEGSGWTGNNQFTVFMSRVGSSLGDWFKARRKE